MLRREAAGQAPDQLVPARVDHRDGVEVPQRDQQVALGERLQARGDAPVEDLDRVGVEELLLALHAREQLAGAAVLEALEHRDALQLLSLGRELDQVVVHAGHLGVEPRDDQLLAPERPDAPVGQHVQVVVRLAGVGPQEPRVAVQAHEADALVDRQDAAVVEQLGAAPLAAAGRVGGHVELRPEPLEGVAPAVHQLAPHVDQVGLGGVSRDEEIEPGCRALGVVARDRHDLGRRAHAVRVAERLELGDPRRRGRSRGARGGRAPLPAGLLLGHGPRIASGAPGKRGGARIGPAGGEGEDQRGERRAGAAQGADSRPGWGRKGPSWPSACRGFPKGSPGAVGAAESERG